MELLMAFNTRVNKFICAFLTVVFTLMVVVIFAQVVFRYALAHPLAWSEELARYLFIWATFFGASVAFYEGTHINVTYFVERIRNARARAAVMILADMACFWFLGMYVYDGMIVSMRIFSLGQFSPSMEWLPIGLVFLAIPLGSFFMIMNILAYTIRHIHAFCLGETIAPVGHN